MILANSVRRRAVGANQSSGRAVHGDALPQTAATPTCVTDRSCGDIFAQFKYVTSSGISNSFRLSPAVLSSGSKVFAVMATGLSRNAEQSARPRGDGRRGRQPIEPSQSPEWEGRAAGGVRSR